MTVRTRNQRAGGEFLARAEAAAKAAGWTIGRTKGRTSRHHRWVSPSGAVVIGSATPSDPRAAYNFMARLRRAGLEI